MRTNIEIDDDLIAKALQATGLKTERAAAEAGLRTLIRLHDQEMILALAGKVIGQATWAKAAKGETRGDPCPKPIVRLRQGGSATWAWRLVDNEHRIQ